MKSESAVDGWMDGEREVSWRVKNKIKQLGLYSSRLYKSLLDRQQVKVSVLTLKWPRYSMEHGSTAVWPTTTVTFTTATSNEGSRPSSAHAQTHSHNLTTRRKISKFVVKSTAYIYTCIVIRRICNEKHYIYSSDVVLETKVLVSRRLEDKNASLGLGLGLEISLGLDLGLDKKVLSIFKPFSSLMTKNHDIVV